MSSTARSQTNLNTVLILRPGVQETSPGELATILGAFCMASSLLCIKSLSETKANTTIIAYSNTLILPAFLVVALQFWQPLDWVKIGWLALMGILLAAPQWFTNRDLSLADARVPPRVDFLRIGFITIIGTVTFAESPNLSAWIDGAIILGSCVYLARHETTSRASAAAQPPPA